MLVTKIRGGSVSWRLQFLSLVGNFGYITVKVTNVVLNLAIIGYVLRMIFTVVIFLLVPSCTSSLRRSYWEPIVQYATQLISVCNISFFILRVNRTYSQCVINLSLGMYHKLVCFVTIQ